MTAIIYSTNLKNSDQKRTLYPATALYIMDKRIQISGRPLLHVLVDLQKAKLDVRRNQRSFNKKQRKIRDGKWPRKETTNTFYIDDVNETKIPVDHIGVLHEETGVYYEIHNVMGSHVTSTHGLRGRSWIWTHKLYKLLQVFINHIQRFDRLTEKAIASRSPGIKLYTAITDTSKPFKSASSLLNLMTMMETLSSRDIIPGIDEFIKAEEERMSKHIASLKPFNSISDYPDKFERLISSSLDKPPMIVIDSLTQLNDEIDKAVDSGALISRGFDKPVFSTSKKDREIEESLKTALPKTYKVGKPPLIVNDSLTQIIDDISKPLEYKGHPLLTRPEDPEADKDRRDSLPPV